MRAIPKKLRSEMDADPYYRTCVCRGYGFGECAGGIQWHHNMIFAGRQVNERFAILPVCYGHHLVADRKDVRSHLNSVMVGRMEGWQLSLYSKAVDWSRVVPTIVPVPSDARILYASSY
jgi:hypothetical protein